MQKWKKTLAKAFIAFFAFELILPVLSIPISQAATSTKKIYYNYDLNQSSDVEVAVQYRPEPTRSFSIDLANHIPFGNIVTGVVLNNNGQDQTAKASLSGTTLNVSNLEGFKTTVYGKSQTLPGHQIYRQPAGRIWEHKGERTPVIEFDGASGSPSPYPGLIPSKGRYRYTTDLFDYTIYTPGDTTKNGPDLRYHYDSPQYKRDGVSDTGASGDTLLDYGNVGYAVTTAYDVPAANNWYLVESNADESGLSADISGSDRLVQSSIEIYGGDTHPSAQNAVTFSYGKGENAGTGMIRTMMALDGSVPPNDYTDTPGTAPHGLLRNYFMYALAKWKGETYKYQTYIEISYKPAETPDLAAQEIKTDNACIPVGSTQTIRYSYKNIGIDTTKAFTVQLKVDGVVVKTENVSGGANNGVLLGGTYSYTFSTSAPKDFSLVVDSGNTVGDTNRANNTINKTFTPQASCGPTPPAQTGTLTGELTIQKSLLPWKEDNLFTVVTRPQGCELDKFKWHISGNGGELTMPPAGAADGGWYPNTNGNTNSYVFAFDHAIKQYPANMKSGTVTVTFTALTSCGTEVPIGPKTFEIGPPPPNNPPQLRVTFVDTAGEPISTAIVGDTVGLKVTELKDPDGDPLTFYWDFEDPMNTTEWVRGLPSKHNWRTPYTSQSYSGMTADVLGMQVVCAYAADGVGSTNACANLDVIPPNPIPKIKGQQTVKVGRPITIPWDSSESYSPVKGRTIDHTKDEWINAKQSYSVVGTEKIQLHVYDNTGLKSLEPDTWDLTVIPDQPPVIDFQYASTISRMAPSYFTNNSYSPDGDHVVVYKTWYGYDANNNGVCNPLENLISSNNANFKFHPDKVGKYCFRLYAEEDYGKNSSKDYIVEVTNDNPDVTFKVSGQSNEPVPTIAAPLNAASLFTSSWMNTTLDKNMFNKKFWSLTPSGTLTSNSRSPINRESGVYQDPNLTFPGSPSSLTLIGELGNYKLNTPIKSAPEYYLGDNVFLWGTNSLGLYGSTPGYFIAGPHIPAPIKLSEGYTDGYRYLYVREDIGELIILFINSASNIREYTFYRHKISDLKAGNPVPIARSVNRDGKFTFSDGKPHDYIERFIKTNVDYKRIDRANNKIESYSFTNLATPYKTETFGTPPSSPVEPAYAVEVFKAPSGMSIFTGPYHTLYWMNGTTGAIDFKSGALNSHPSDILTGPWATNENETLITYRVGSSVAGWSPGYDHQVRFFDFAKKMLYQYYPCDGCFYPENPTESTDFSGILENKYGLNNPIDGYNIYNFGNWYTPDWWIVDSRNNSKIWQVGSGCGRPEVYSENLFVACGKVYTFTKAAPLPGVNEYFSFGQLINPGMQKAADGSINWTMRINNLKYDQVPAGMSFRIQDHKNMYRVEVMKNRLRLVKIVNGQRTVLAESVRNLASGTWMKYSVKMSGNEIKIYENSTPLFNVYDNAYSTGTYGPYSVHETTEFKDMGALIASPYLMNKTEGIALVDSPVEYATTFTDPENDPRHDNGTQWKYAHVDTTIFLDIGDGKSGLSSRHGQTATTPMLNFDKVGVYKIQYRAPDDPHPNHRLANGAQAFKNYSKYSNWYTQQLIVHRAPKSIFTLSIAPNKTVAWTDYSYDPDRCYSKGNCQTPYADSNGIYAKKFYYITPSGNTVVSKLVRPTEVGVYNVYMAVQDEYGAWSDWYEQTITVTVIPPPNVPPTVTLTFPTGTQANPTPVSLQPTIRWNQADANPGTIFTAFTLRIKDEAGFCVECLNHQVMETTATSWAWTMDNRLLIGQKYSAQVQVSDGEAWSGWSNIGWMTTNRPPAAYMSYPYGTQATPTIANTLRPTLTWSQTDPDPGTIFTHFQIQITNEANTVMVLDSGKVVQNTANTSGSWTVTRDLPAGQKLKVRVMVWDQYGAASNWSPQAWLYINRPPSGNLTYSNPIYEHDTPEFTIISSDPDGDALSITVESSFNGGAFSSIQHWAYVPSGQKRAFIYGPIPEGDYTFRLTLDDGRGGTYQQTYSFVVLPLDIIGWVGHTAEWESYRQTWNAKYPQQQREAREFWAGEAFELAARVTDTGVSTTKPDYVDATLLETGEAVLLAGGNGVRFTGQLLNTDHVRMLQNGEDYTFRFKVRWSNGLEQTADISIRILGSVYDVIVNQIRH